MEWQHTFHLTRQHLETGGELPTQPGTVMHQGEDLGQWVQAQRLGRDRLTTVQQWMCEQILGITPATEDEKPPPRRTQADKWVTHYEAARQFYEREGHLRVPRKHVERIVVGDIGRGDVAGLTFRIRTVGTTRHRVADAAGRHGSANEGGED
ncbi:helicase associated domain-containing protein [Streptomyces sp. NPDC058287]|uniref:helicase associated domain-containing protein n=1 Tax=Streptomyces sp. NPDC058287 TaxID=3346423 RepID=UPI0036E8625C